MSFLKAPVATERLSEDEREKARLKLCHIKNEVRLCADNAKNLEESGFFDKLDGLFTNEGGLSPEAIAAGMSFDDCTMLYAYYSDLVTRDDDGNAMNAYGAGFLGYRMILNDIVKIGSPGAISAAKYCSVASLVLYDKAVNDEDWDEYKARRLLIRDAFYLYPDRLGKNRLMNGALKSTFWSDVVTLTEDEVGWDNVINNYELSEKDIIPTPTALANWWAEVFEGGFSPRDILRCILSKLAAWKAVCLVGYWKKNKLLPDIDGVGRDYADTLYSLIVQAYDKMDHKRKNEGFDSAGKIAEYGTYFGLSLIKDVPKGEILTRDQWEAWGANDKGVMFSDKEGAKKDKPSMKSRVLAKQNKSGKKIKVAKD